MARRIATSSASSFETDDKGPREVVASTLSHMAAEPHPLFRIKDPSVKKTIEPSSCLACDCVRVSSLASSLLSSRLKTVPVFLVQDGSR